MDGKKNNNRSSSSSSSTSEGKVARKTSHSGLFNSVFPPLMDRKESSHSEIFGLPRKQEECLNHVWSNPYKEGEDVRGNTSKAYKKTTTTTALYGSERSDPSNLSDSLYYGGQDIYSETSQTSQSTYDKKDGEDNTGSSDYASRGNWWQGSLYY